MNLSFRVTEPKPNRDRHPGSQRPTAPYGSLCLRVLQDAEVFAVFADIYPLSQQRFHHLTMYIGQAEITTLKTVSQSLVIDTEQMQHGGM